MLRDKIREEIRDESAYGLINGKRVVAWKTVKRILMFPFALLIKLCEWVYYDNTEEQLERIRRGF